MTDNPPSHPADGYSVPWRRRAAYARAVSAFIRPGDPETVTLAEADRFYRTASWRKLHAALEAALAPPPGESLTLHIMQLFEAQKAEGTLRD